jgi:hypothetical protein
LEKIVAANNAEPVDCMKSKSGSPVIMIRMMEKARWPYFVVILLLPIAFFAPNLRPGRVMLPLDILHHWEPFSGSIPEPLAKVHNPHLADLVALYHPSIELSRRAQRQAVLWNPYSFCGSPLLANAQNGLLFPLSWCFRFFSPGVAYLLVAFAKMWFCGLFAFLFFRKVGFQPLSSLMGSITFMFCGHMIAWFGYPTSFPLVSWPFLFWALQSFLNRPEARNLAWLATGFGLIFIGGQPQTGFLISLAAVIYLAAHAARPDRRNVGIWLGFASAAALGFCVAAPQILPFFEYASQSTAAVVRSMPGHYGWKQYGWHSLMSWVMPRFFGDPRTGNFWGFSSFLGEAIYIGVIPLVLVALGLIHSSKGSRFYRATLAISIAGGLGLYFGPVSRAYWAIPLLSSIDNNKLIALVAFGLISGSTIGIDRLLTGLLDSAKALRGWAWATAAWIAFAAAGMFFFRDALHAMNLQAFEAREAGWMAAFLMAGGAILWLAGRHRLTVTAAAGLLIVVTVCDLFRIWQNYYPSYPETYLIPRSEAIAYLRDHASGDRILGLGDTLPPLGSALFQLQDVRGYDGMTPYRYYRMLAKIDANVQNLWFKLQRSRPAAGAWTPATLFYRSLERYLDSEDPKVKGDLSHIDYWSNGISNIDRPALVSMMGVRFILNPKGAPVPKEADLRLIHSSDAEVWENPKVLPRAFTATRPLFVDSDEAALDAVAAQDFPFERTAVVTLEAANVKRPEVREEGVAALIPAKILRYEAEYVEIQADAPRGGWLILSDLFYPGWKATCDGAAAPILAGNYMFRAVPMPPGVHIVKFSYQPLTFRIGCILALAAALGILLLWVSCKLRRGNPAPGA